MPVIKTFPATIARENSAMFELTGMTISSGQTASGVMPLARMDGGGLWKATFSDVAIVTIEQVLAWRQIAAYCDGGVSPIIVPFCETRYQPGLAKLAQTFVPHSDDTPHSDDSPYSGGSRLDARFGAPAVLRQTVVHISFLTGGPFVGGEHFSVNHPTIGPRLYRVVNADGPLVEIRPPLRGPIPTGTILELEHPACVMRLATSDAMDLTLTQRKFGRPSVDFLEAFPPFPAGLTLPT
jgi:hypothetical protein